MTSTRRVYSTEVGRICPDCDRVLSDCICKQLNNTNSGATIRVFLDKKKRAGKVVTVVSGLPGDKTQLKTIAKSLKQHCGCGGSVVKTTIELQGDWKEKVLSSLKDMGYKPS